jgi:hypothetical protein
MSAQAIDPAAVIPTAGAINFDLTMRNFGLSAVSMRHGASTCIRSQHLLRNHNRYSRKPEPEAAAGDQTTTGLLPAINLPGRQPPYCTGSKLDNLRRLSLKRGSFGNDALFNKTPQGDGKLASQGNDADLAAAHSLVAEPFMPPLGKFTCRLIPEPEPRQLDHSRTSELGAGFTNPSVSADRSAGERAWRQAHEGRDMASGREGPVIDLRHQSCGSRLTDAIQHGEPHNLVPAREAARCFGQSASAVSFGARNLLVDKGQVLKHAPDIAQEERAEQPAVTSLQGWQACLQCLADSFAGQPDAMQGEEAFDASDDTGALLDQALASALDPLGIFFVDRRNADLASNAAVAGKPRPQGAGHALRIEPIGLGQSAAARQQEAGGIENDCANPALIEQPRQPEAVVATS